jgi:predicted ester cyclase
MSTEENKALVRRLFQAIDDGQIDEAIDLCMVEEYNDHNPPPAPGLAPGRAGTHQGAAMVKAAFPDAKHAIDFQVAEGDLVVTQVTAKGTHTGSIMGETPTGRAVTATGITVHRVVHGKLVEKWSQTDFMGLMTQMGILQAPGGVPAS